MDRCSLCGFVYDDLPLVEIASAIRGFGARYRAELGGVDEAVARTRPTPEMWCALEYACHVRDLLLVQRDRALLALVEDRPSVARMYRDERVALAHYAAHPPAAVIDQLEMAAELCALVFDGLSSAELGRPLIYNYPVATEHDIGWLGRHTVHEGEHHLGDIRAVLAQLRHHTR